MKREWLQPGRSAVIVALSVSVLLVALAAGSFAQQMRPMQMTQPMRQMNRQQMNQMMNQQMNQMMMAQMQAQTAQMNGMIKQLRAQFDKIKPELLTPQELAMYDYLKLMQVHMETMPPMMNTMQSMMMMSMMQGGMRGTMPMPSPTHRR